jgi:hypothetical protein
MKLRRDKGLCFNYNDRFHKGHRCKDKQFMLLLGDANSDPQPDPLYTYLAPYIPDPAQTPSPSSLLSIPAPDLNPPPPTPPDSPDSELFQLSLQVATGQPSPRTLRFTATILNHSVTILVDSGSSHNIIQPRIASFLHLPIQTLVFFSCDGWQ